MFRHLGQADAWLVFSERNMHAMHMHCKQKMHAMHGNFDTAPEVCRITLAEKQEAPAWGEGFGHSPFGSSVRSRSTL